MTNPLTSADMHRYFALVHHHTDPHHVIGLTTIAGTFASTRWYQRQYIDRLIADAERIGDAANVYVRIAPLAAKPTGGRGLERASVGSSVLFVDYDTYADKSAGLARLRSMPLPPSMIVDSGNGFHAYWLLSQFETDIDAIKARNKGLMLDLRADSVFDLARILRVPGTFNVKREPIPCVIVDYHDDRVYSLGDFEAAPLDDTDRALDTWETEALPPDFLERLDPYIAQRITHGNGSDRSTNDHFIACYLLENGYTQGQVLTVLTHPQWASGDKGRDRRGYADRTLANALAKARKNEMNATAASLDTASAEDKRPYLTEAELYNLPPPTYLLDTEIVAGEITVLYAPSGTGKTFVALDYAWRASSLGAVMYVAAEDVHGLSIRARAWRAYYRSPDNGNVLVWNEELNLMNSASIDDFIRHVAPRSPKLVVIDTLALCMYGADENSAKDMGIAIHNIKRIQRATNAAIILVHHTGKSGVEERGSSALRGAAYTMISLTEDQGVLTLKCEKAKNSEPFKSRLLRLEKSEESAVIVSADGYFDLRMRSDDRLVLQAIYDLGIAPFKAIREKTLLRDKALAAVLRRLKDAGWATKGDKKTDPYEITELGEEQLSHSDV